MIQTSPLITLNNGVRMPTLGLGVLNRDAPERTADAVECAIADGYRLIDVAASYGNERLVGEGIARSRINRSEIFVTTKLWISDYGYEQALRACEVSLCKLGLDYVDLYLLHWPVPSDFETTIASYRAAEKLLVDGGYAQSEWLILPQGTYQISSRIPKLYSQSIRSNCIRSSSKGKHATPTRGMASSHNHGPRSVAFT